MPKAAPATAQARNAFLKAAARWLARAGVRAALKAGLRIGLEATIGGPVGDFLLAMEAAYWLYKFLPYISTAAFSCRAELGCAQEVRSSQATVGLDAHKATVGKLVDRFAAICVGQNGALEIDEISKFNRLFREMISIGTSFGAVPAINARHCSRFCGIRLC